MLPGVTNLQHTVEARVTRHAHPIDTDGVKKLATLLILYEE